MQDSRIAIKNGGAESLSRPRRKISPTLLLIPIIIAGAGLMVARPGIQERLWALEPVAVLAARAAEHPEDLALYRYLARRQLNQGDPVAALRTAAWPARAEPEDPNSWLLLGDAALTAGRLDAAERAYRQALALSPDDPDAHLGLARYFAAAGSSHGAVNHLQRFTTLRSRDPEGWRLLAEQWLELSQPGNALDAAKKALVQGADDPRALVLAGQACYRLGRFDEAGSHFARALRLAPGTADASVGASMVELTRATPESRKRALQLLRQAVESDPDHQDARFELGQALADAGELTGAVEAWEGVLDLNPDNARAHHALGLSLRRLGRSREAALHHKKFELLQAYQAELAASAAPAAGDGKPSNPVVEARIHLKYNRPDRAGEALKRALERNPDNAWAQAQLARIEQSP